MPCHYECIDAGNSKCSNLFSFAIGSRQSALNKLKCIEKIAPCYFIKLHGNYAVNYNLFNADCQQPMATSGFPQATHYKVSSLSLG
jgi:hypothetical protein